MKPKQISINCNLQEFIYIQTEIVKKVDVERQQVEAKSKKDIESTVSTNAKATADLKTEVEDVIIKSDITLIQKQTKDNSTLLAMHDISLERVRKTCLLSCRRKFYTCGKCEKVFS